jgi:hypothetical protein
MLDPDRRPMPPEKWERVKAQVRENVRLIHEHRAKKLLQRQQSENRWSAPPSPG